MAILTARNKRCRIAGAVGQLAAWWLAILTEIVLVLGFASVPLGPIEGGGAWLGRPAQICASRPYDFEGGTETIS